MLPDRQVSGTVANIVEAAFSKGADEDARLFISGEVDGIVRREHTVEESEMSRNPLRMATIGGCGQIDRPSGVLGLAYQFENFGVERKERIVDRASLGKVRLQRRFSAAECGEGLSMMIDAILDRRKEALIKQVGVNQAAIEIDHERDIRHRQVLAFGLGNSAQLCHRSALILELDGVTAAMD